MKVLLAYNQHRGPGGSEKAAVELVESLRSHGVEVAAFTRDSATELTGLSGRIEAAVNLVYAPRSVDRFERLLTEFKPDVVHVQELFPLVSPWILPACKRRGIPVVMTCIDYRMTCSKTTHLNSGQICVSCVKGRDYRAVLKNCRGSVVESLMAAAYNHIVRTSRVFVDNVSVFLAPSLFTREWLIEHAGLPSDRVTVLSPMIHVPRVPANAADGEYVAYAGRFSPEKGLDVLFKARALSGVPFRLSRSAASSVSVEVPPDADVVVTQSRDELDCFYRHARMLVVPSVWFETFGIVGAEAMSYGIPVIASDLGALKSLVTHGQDGLLFPSGDAQELSRLIQQLWRDPDLCSRLGKAGREKVMAEWAPEVYLRKLLDIYSRCIRGKLQYEQEFELNVHC